MKKPEACAYTFLYEESKICDYEVATDELASLIGLADHDVETFDLRPYVEMVYHVNGSIRGKIAITEETIATLIATQKELTNELGSWKDFVLPMGSKGSAQLHLIRSRSKAIIRILQAIDRESNREPRMVVHEFFHNLSNLFFLMALLENKRVGVEEVIFRSNSY